MQTFLPYASFIQSAKVLDNKRLGKQRVEAYQILKALLDPGYGWQHHPAVKMWRGYELTLLSYATIVCNEWTSRGYKDTVRDKLMLLNDTYTMTYRGRPSWFGSRRFHEGHRSNLLRKDAKHYRRFWPRLRTDLPYYWPVR